MEAHMRPLSAGTLILVLALALVTSPVHRAASQTPVAAKDSVGGGRWGSYTPNAGFKLAKTDLGEVNLKVYTYVRYLNQKGLDGSYRDHYGDSIGIDRRQDIQLNKVNIQFPGWLLDPDFRFMVYVWTNNTAQGQGAQVVVAGNLTYTFNRHVTLGGGINALPGARSTEGSFPFWLTNDNRYIADEFFRPSYTTGIWVKGTVVDGLTYTAMLGNNLSQLGVDAGQLDEHLNTVSGSLVWRPTTGEFGLNGSFGDLEHHQDAATQVGVRYTRSPEDRQGVPASEAFENVTIRLSDGTVIFKPDAFGPGIQLDNATYNMTSVDAGVKYMGFSLEGEYYWRWVNDFRGRGVDNLTFDRLTDSGLQLQASGMVIPGRLQVYSGYSKIFGEYGNPWDMRFGLNYHPFGNHVVRCNLEYLHTEKSPVGGLSLPYQVGGTGDIVYANFEVNF
jgi:hypothetical protein